MHVCCGQLPSLRACLSDACHLTAEQWLLVEGSKTRPQGCKPGVTTLAHWLRIIGLKQLAHAVSPSGVPAVQPWVTAVGHSTAAVVVALTCWKLTHLLPEDHTRAGALCPACIPTTRGAWMLCSCSHTKRVWDAHARTPQPAPPPTHPPPFTHRHTQAHTGTYRHTLRHTCQCVTRGCAPSLSLSLAPTRVSALLCSPHERR